MTQISHYLAQGVASTQGGGETFLLEDFIKSLSLICHHSSAYLNRTDGLLILHTYCVLCTSL